MQTIIDAGETIPSTLPLLAGSYAAWQWYDRDGLASPENIRFEKYSRVDYAYFQVDSAGFVFGTDSWADPNVLFGPYDFGGPADLPDECRGGSNGMGGDDRGPCERVERCHRNFPNSKSCNLHIYEEGLIYRAHAAGTRVYAAIGGWTLSGNFSGVAADEAKRKLFAKECAGLIEDYGFDGIVIDWEYPGYEPHGGAPRDRVNFNALLLAIREALDAHRIESDDAPLDGGAFGLAAALPCEPSRIDFLDVPFLDAVLDGMDLMTFDFHDARMERVTGANSPLYDQEWDEAEGSSVDGCVRNYVDAGASAGKISIGVPFYGKTFSYATELNGYHSNTYGKQGGSVDQNNWPRDLGTPVYYSIIQKLNEGNMVSQRHEATKTQYAYFKDGSGLVTYDDPQAVCDKADYVNVNKLGGLFVWEMSGDLMQNLETPLIDAINVKLEAPDFDCRSAPTIMPPAFAPTVPPTITPTITLTTITPTTRPPTPAPMKIPAPPLAFFCGACPWKGSNFDCDARVAFIQGTYGTTTEQAQKDLMEGGQCVDPSYVATDVAASNNTDSNDGSESDLPSVTPSTSAPPAVPMNSTTSTPTTRPPTATSVTTPTPTESARPVAPGNSTTSAPSTSVTLVTSSKTEKPSTIAPATSVPNSMTIAPTTSVPMTSAPNFPMSPPLATSANSTTPTASARPVTPGNSTTSAPSTSVTPVTSSTTEKPSTSTPNSTTSAPTTNVPNSTTISSMTSAPTTTLGNSTPISLTISLPPATSPPSATPTRNAPPATTTPTRRLANEGESAATDEPFSPMPYSENNPALEEDMAGADAVLSSASFLRLHGVAVGAIAVGDALLSAFVYDAILS